MLSYLFNNEDADIYIKLLIIIAKADGYIHPSEKKYIDLQARIFLINPDDYWENDLENINDIDFDRLSKLTKISILRDLIVLAFIDGVYDPKEQDKIKELSEKMGISNKELEELEDWLHRYFNLIQESKKFFIEE